MRVGRKGGRWGGCRLNCVVCGVDCGWGDDDGWDQGLHGDCFSLIPTRRRRIAHTLNWLGGAEDVCMGGIVGGGREGGGDGISLFTWHQKKQVSEGLGI